MDKTKVEFKFLMFPRFMKKWKNSDLGVKSYAPLSEGGAKLATVYPLTSAYQLQTTDASTETTSATSGYPYTYAQVAL